MTTTPCPWCSEPVVANAATCPACDAALVAPNDADLPGLTSVADRGQITPRKRNRLINWLVGEKGADAPSDRSGGS